MVEKVRDSNYLIAFASVLAVGACHEASKFIKNSGPRDAKFYTYSALDFFKYAFICIGSLCIYKSFTNRSVKKIIISKNEYDEFMQKRLNELESQLKPVIAS